MTEDTVVQEGTSKTKCPYHGPDKITMNSEGGLVHCDALAAFRKTDGQDGRGCLYLHAKASPRQCPLNGSALT